MNDLPRLIRWPARLRLQPRRPLTVYRLAMQISVSIGAALASIAVSAAHVESSSRPYKAEWPSYNNTLDGQRFSPLDQLTPENVGQLKELCRIQVADGGAFESDILYVNETIFVATDRSTVAIDLKRCAVKWRAVYDFEQLELWPINRGLAYANGRLFRGTGDGRLMALDEVTGAIVWKEVAADPLVGEFFSAAPVVWEGILIIGTGGGDLGARGRVMGFDAATGRELWRFNTIPTEHEPGAESWETPLSAQTGGGGTWSTYTVDLASAEIFVPVGNPGPDFLPRYRPGANLFTDSIVVLDARTGALKWWYQLTPHDSRDLDMSAAPVLFRSSEGHRLVGFASKDGYLRSVDRETHELKFQTAVTTIEKDSADSDLGPVRACPGVLGGTEWNGPAFDRLSMLLLTPAVDWCSTIQSGPEHMEPGTARGFLGGTFSFAGQSASGWLTAVDAITGEVRWKYHADAPLVAGVTATAGGVVMTGDVAGNFLVFETATGRLLLRQQTGGALAGGVITFSQEGQQYVAFTSGNVSRSTFGAVGLPSVVIEGIPVHSVRTAKRRVDASAPTGIPARTLSAKAPGKRGEKLFAENCAVCHGVKGDGSGTGPSLVDVNKRLSKQAIASQIKSPRQSMPHLYPSVLSDADIDDLVTYLQNF